MEDPAASAREVLEQTLLMVPLSRAGVQADSNTSLNALLRSALTTLSPSPTKNASKRSPSGAFVVPIQQIIDGELLDPFGSAPVGSPNNREMEMLSSARHYEPNSEYGQFLTRMASPAAFQSDEDRLSPSALLASMRLYHSAPSSPIHGGSNHFSPISSKFGSRAAATPSPSSASQFSPSSGARPNSSIASNENPSADASSEPSDDSNNKKPVSLEEILSMNELSPPPLPKPSAAFLTTERFKKPLRQQESPPPIGHYRVKYSLTDPRMKTADFNFRPPSPTKSKQFFPLSSSPTPSSPSPSPPPPSIQHHQLLPTPSPITPLRPSVSIAPGDASDPSNASPSSPSSNNNNPSPSQIPLFASISPQQAVRNSTLGPDAVKWVDMRSSSPQRQGLSSIISKVPNAAHSETWRPPSPDKFYNPNADAESKYSRIPSPVHMDRQLQRDESSCDGPPSQSPDIMYSVNWKAVAATGPREKAELRIGKQVPRSKAAELSQTMQSRTQHAPAPFHPRGLIQYPADHRAYKVSEKHVIPRSPAPVDLSKSMGRERPPELNMPRVAVDPLVEYDSPVAKDKLATIKPRDFDMEKMEARPDYLQQLPLDLDYGQDADPLNHSRKSPSAMFDATRGHQKLYSPPISKDLLYDITPVVPRVPQSDFGIATDRSKAMNPLHVRSHKSTLDQLYDADPIGSRLIGNPMIKDMLGREEHSRGRTARPASPDKFYDPNLDASKAKTPQTVAFERVVSREARVVSKIAPRSDKSIAAQRAIDDERISSWEATQSLEVAPAAAAAVERASR